MDIRQYFNSIIKYIWIIILLSVIAGLTSLFLSYRYYSPIYESNETLLVINNSEDKQLPSDYYELMAGQQLVKEYKELITSRMVTKTVIDDLKLKDLSPDALAGKISVSLVGDTRILRISVKDVLPARTKQLVDKICEVFTKKAFEIMKVDNVQVIDYAEMPTAPLAPQHKKKALIGFSIGLLLGLAVVFVIEELDDTIKIAEDVEKELGLKVIGTIPTMNIK